MRTTYARTVQPLQSRCPPWADVRAPATDSDTHLQWPASADQIDTVLGFLRDQRLPDGLDSTQREQLRQDAHRLCLPELLQEITCLWPLRQQAKCAPHAEALLALGDGLWKAQHVDAALREWSRGHALPIPAPLRARWQAQASQLFGRRRDRGLAHFHLMAHDVFARRPASALGHERQALRLMPELATACDWLRRGGSASFCTEPTGQPPATWGPPAKVDHDPIGGAFLSSFDNTRSILISARGTPFLLSPDALHALAEDSTLHAFCRYHPPTASHALFLDVDPQAFAVIDSYLHSGLLPIEWPLAGLSRLRREAKYLGLWALLTQIDEFWPWRRRIATAKTKTDKAMALFALGDTYARWQRPAEAFCCWQDALATGEAAASITALRRRVGDDGASAVQKAFAHYHLGVLLALQHGPSEAKTHAQGALRLRPGWPMAARLLLAAHLARGELDEVLAMDDLPMGPPADGEASLAWIQALVASIALAHPFEPASLFLRVVAFASHDEEATPAIQAVDALLDYAPRSAFWQRHLVALLQHNAECAPEAWASLQRACARWPLDPQASAQTADMLLAAGQNEASLEVTSAAIDAFPTHQSLRLVHVRALMALGHNAQARQACANLLQWAPDDIGARLAWAQLQLRLGLREKAVELLDPLLGPSSRDLDSAPACIDLLFDLGEDARALTVMRHHLTTFPLVVVTRVRLGMMLIGRRLFDDALRLAIDALSVRPGHVGALAVAIEALARSGQGQQAERLLRQHIVVEQAPAAWLAWVGLGLLNEGGQDDSDEAALRYAEHALQRDPTQPLAWSVKVRALLGLGRLEAAQAAWEHAQQAVGAHPHLVLAEATLRLLQNNFAAAHQAFAAIDPSELEFAGLVHRAMAQGGVGDVAGAVAALEALGDLPALVAELLCEWLDELGRHEDLETTARHYADKFPQEVVFLDHLHTALLALQRDEEALEVVGQARRRTPGSARLWRDEAFLLRRLGQWDRALACAQEAVALEPSSESWVALALGWLALDEDRQVRHALLAAAAQPPVSAWVWTRIAEAYWVLKDWGAAAHAFGRAAKEDPSQSSAYLNWGRGLLKCPQSVEAAHRVLRRALKDPNLRAQAWPLLAQAHRQQGQLLAASVAIEQALQSEPDNTAWLQQAVELAWQRQRYDEAQNPLHTLIAASSASSPRLRHLYGLALLAAHRPDEAVHQWQVVLAESPSDPRALACLAQHGLRTHAPGSAAFAEALADHGALGQRPDADPLWAPTQWAHAMRQAMACGGTKQQVISRAFERIAPAQTMSVADVFVAHSEWALLRQWALRAIQAQPRAIAEATRWTPYLMVAGAPNEAAAALRQAEAIGDKRSLRSRMRLATGWFQVGDYARCDDHLVDVLRRRPRHLSALHLRAVCQRQMGHGRQSRPELLASIALAADKDGLLLRQQPFWANGIDEHHGAPPAQQRQFAQHLIDYGHADMVDPADWVRVWRQSGDALQAAHIADALHTARPQNVSFYQQWCASLLELRGQE